jgi:hypothetical protein
MVFDLSPEQAHLAPGAAPVAILSVLDGRDTFWPLVVGVPQ